MKHAHQGPKPGRRARRHGGLRRFLLVFFLALAALGVAGGFAGYRLYRDAESVQADAQKVLAVTDTLKQAVRDGDGPEVATVMNEVAAASSRMRATTHTTLWNVASYVPVYGEDVRMAQSLTATLDDLAANGLVPLGNGLARVDLDSLIGDDGSVDVATMQAAVAALQAGAPAVHQANAEIQALPDAHIEKLGSMVDKAKDKFASIDEAVTTTFVGAVLCMLFTWVLIPPFGLVGASVAMVIGNAVVFLLRLRSSQSIIRFDMKPLRLAVSSLLLAAQSAVVYVQVPGWRVFSAAVFVILAALHVVANRRLLRLAIVAVRARVQAGH